ncbi:MAG: response regulator transcription factor [Anaerolineae bacterium]|nr:response regulator transcription factor [Anaerolineae bacterium]
MTAVSVLLVDDNRLFLRLITKFLQEQAAAEVRVVGVAHTGHEALRQGQALRPQVILLDLAMPGFSGLEVIPRLRKSLPSLIIIVLTRQKAEAYRPAVLKAGADAFISKATLTTDLLPALRRLAQTTPEA